MSRVIPVGVEQLGVHVIEDMTDVLHSNVSATYTYQDCSFMSMSVYH